MSSSEASHHQLDDLLVDLEQASKTPAKQRAVKISKLIDRLTSKAYEEGLSDAALSRIVDVLTLPNELDQASLGSLIRNLYPATRIPDAIVVNIVGILGHGKGKPSFAVQGLLLKWLIMVYDVLENPSILSKLYAVLFNLLDTISIRPQLCHVLSVITRRKHVRMYRIQMLMELTRQAGKEPPLVGLMRVYKDYYPDIIVGDITIGRASVFTHPDKEWRQRLIEIQETHRQKTRSLELEQQSFRVTRRGLIEKKRNAASVIPEVRTSRAQESSTTLEEIANVDDFVRKLEKIELPNQMVAVMGDPLLQKLLQLRSSDATVRRVDNWLMAFFEDQLQSPDQSGKDILAMLSAIRDYTRYTKVLPSACFMYLRAMLASWNGVTGRNLILDLLAYTPISSFTELQTTIFQALEDALLDGTVESQIALLTFYTDLLKQWTTSLLMISDHTDEHAEAVRSLINHASQLSLVILQVSSSIPAYSKILDFYETAAFLGSQPSLASLRCIVIPPSALIYTLNFTQSINILGRLCDVLAVYKQALEAAMTSAVTTKAPSYDKASVNRFNGFIMDICNCLWRSRAFNTSDPNAHGCLIPPEALPGLTAYVAGLNTQLQLPSLFNLSCAPSLALLSISYVREEEDKKDDEIEMRHAGPATQKSLANLARNGGITLPWADYRLGVLQYLEKKGVSGIGALMSNTMKHLMKK